MAKRTNLTVMLQVRVDRKTKQLLGQAARAEQVPESQIVRRLLRAHLERTASPR